LPYILTAIHPVGFSNCFEDNDFDSREGDSEDEGDCENWNDDSDYLEDEGDQDMDQYDLADPFIDNEEEYIQKKPRKRKIKRIIVEDSE
jgi:hypothetical protein